MSFSLRGAERSSSSTTVHYQHHSVSTRKESGSSNTNDKPPIPHSFNQSRPVEQSINNNNNNSNHVGGGFPVDNCFELGVERLRAARADNPAAVPLPTYLNYDCFGENNEGGDRRKEKNNLYTFEEFISKRGGGRKASSEANSTDDDGSSALSSAALSPVRQQRREREAAATAQPLSVASYGGMAFDSASCGLAAMGSSAGGGSNGALLLDDKFLLAKISASITEDLLLDGSSEKIDPSVSSAPQSGFAANFDDDPAAPSQSRPSQKRQSGFFKSLKSGKSGGSAAPGDPSSPTDGVGGISAKNCAPPTLLRHAFCQTVGDDADGSPSRGAGGSLASAYGYLNRQRTDANDGGCSNGSVQKVPTACDGAFETVPKDPFGTTRIRRVNNFDSISRMEEMVYGDDGFTTTGLPMASSSSSAHNASVFDIPVAAVGAPTDVVAEKRRQRRCRHVSGGTSAFAAFLSTKLFCCFRTAFSSSTSAEDGTMSSVVGRYRRKNDGDDVNNAGSAVVSEAVDCQNVMDDAANGGRQIGTSDIKMSVVRKWFGTAAATPDANVPPTMLSSAKSYSWDKREIGVDGGATETVRGPPNPSDFRFADEKRRLLFKAPSTVAGQAFTIENCVDCILIVLDYSAAVTIDDCRNCLIVVGPCKSSVFVRDSTNCVIYAICQQFRARDSRGIRARLFCATAPTIEDTDVEFGPLNVCYNEIEEQMAAVGLSPFTNHWNRVHNFTPETAKYRLVKATAGGTEAGEECYNNASAETGLVECALNDRFRREFLEDGDGSSRVHNLTFGPHTSFFFHTNVGGEGREAERRILVLVRCPLAVHSNTTTDGGKKSRNIAVASDAAAFTHRELHHRVRHFLKRLVGAETAEDDRFRLVAIYDLDCRAGEAESVLQISAPPKALSTAYRGGTKLVGIELAAIAKNEPKAFLRDDFRVVEAFGCGGASTTGGGAALMAPIIDVIGGDDDGDDSSSDRRAADCAKLLARLSDIKCSA